MEAYLRKHFWLVYLALIASCAFFAARAVGQLVAAQIPIPRPGPARGPALVAPPPIQRATDWNAVAMRNIFCAACAPAPVEAPTAPIAGGAAPGPAEPVKSSSTLQLLATLVSERDAAWSLAALFDPAAGRTQVHGIGSQIDGLTVIEIRPRRVLLQQGARLEYIEIDQGAAATAGAMPTAAAPPFPSAAPAYGGGDELGAQVASGVRATGATSWEIQRSALNRVLTNTTLLARSARIIPSIRNGKADGFRIVGIRPGSLYSLIGIQSGDLIQAINGLPMTTPEAALEVYTKVRSASHLSISFNRMGKPLTHDYVIR